MPPQKKLFFIRPSLSCPTVGSRPVPRLLDDPAWRPGEELRGGGGHPHHLLPQALPHLLTSQVTEKKQAQIKEVGLKSFFEKWCPGKGWASSLLGWWLVGWLQLKSRFEYFSWKPTQDLQCITMFDKHFMDPIPYKTLQVGRPDRDCPGGSERLAIIAISPDTIRWQVLVLLVMLVLVLVLLVGLG